MSPWVLRGLRNGVVTTRWPGRPDPYADGWRGPATVLDPRPGGPPGQQAPAGLAGPAAPDRAGLASLCPTGAITIAADGAVRLDQGRCILCGRCVELRPDVFGWSQGAAAAALSRDGLLVPEEPGAEQEIAAVRAALRARTAALRRSVHLRHVDAGSDGAEEQEIMALLNPVYDINRLGIFFTASPRHADVLLVTGAGAHGMAEPLRRTYTGMPDPKIVIAVGTDAVSGGLIGSHLGSYATAAGVGEAVPVDVWVPGSPPSPFNILHALLAALGRLPHRAAKG
ncbi:MAG: ferredoxin [Streptosporangiaceae bacterium]